MGKATEMKPETREWVNSMTSLMNLLREKRSEEKYRLKREKSERAEKLYEEISIEKFNKRIEAIAIFTKKMDSVIRIIREINYTENDKGGFFCFIKEIKRNGNKLLLEPVKYHINRKSFSINDIIKRRKINNQITNLYSGYERYTMLNGDNIQYIEGGFKFQFQNKTSDKEKKINKKYHLLINHKMVEDYDIVYEHNVLFDKLRSPPYPDYIKGDKIQLILHDENYERYTEFCLKQDNVLSKYKHLNLYGVLEWL